ncbi:FecR family protein [Pedobacter rhodius]|uniref:FecR domain-containing protein n=1 Tax=Pedobacter rhodius TaxID=3004098 RepID=A0ABT4KW36_9SPHI|nr:FecR domain-containing protein [Pedobacter sp. SJ11]MCZ4223147.1 FecR domain-containing protein [Pedobacter sp. SJ11]
MDFLKYINYSFEDFLNDDAFLQFVNEQKKSDLAAWNKFKTDYPQRTKIAETAFNAIITYRTQDTFFNESAQAKVFDRITSTISNQKQSRKIIKFPLFLKVAAAFTVIFLSVFIYNNFINKEIRETDFGKIRTVVLPDGSEVTLNGNSKITYAKNFNKGIREVWIDGEALFKVKHLNIDTNNIKPEEKFIVHCSDINIEVLGTVFNVRNRHEKTSVGLLSGKIRIDYKDLTKVKKQFIMAPGDFVKHGEGNNLIHQKLEDPERLTAWTTRQLVFKNATLEDISLVLTDDLGYHVNIDEKLSKQKIEGEISVNDVNDLIRILKTTLHLNIETENKNITIKE